jgi:hypothetical protein
VIVLLLELVSQSRQADLTYVMVAGCCGPSSTGTQLSIVYGIRWCIRHRCDDGHEKLPRDGQIAARWRTSELPGGGH